MKCWKENLMEEYLPNTSDVLASVLFLRQDLNIHVYIAIYIHT